MALTTEENPMIEVNKTYDLLPRIDQQAYLGYTRRATASMLKAPGLVEIRSYRSLLGSPQVRLTLVWQTLADWAAFAESPERQMLDSELFTYATNIGVEVWGPSPAMPEPLRPGT
jgi:antibiotic biosynthesis monooxygenase (ABM) superfamily enzyme